MRECFESLPSIRRAIHRISKLCLFTATKSPRQKGRRLLITDLRVFVSRITKNSCSGVLHNGGLAEISPVDLTKISPGNGRTVKNARDAATVFCGGVPAENISRRGVEIIQCMAAPLLRCLLSSFLAFLESTANPIAGHRM